MNATSGAFETSLSTFQLVEYPLGATRIALFRVVPIELMKLEFPPFPCSMITTGKGPVPVGTRTAAVRTKPVGCCRRHHSVDGCDSAELADQHPSKNRPATRKGGRVGDVATHAGFLDRRQGAWITPLPFSEKLSRMKIVPETLPKQLPPM